MFNAGILVGFFIIGFTWLAISSWLTLSLNNYGLWKNVHVYAIIQTLILTGIKIGIHWCWITATARKIFDGSMKQTWHESPVLRPVPVAISITNDTSSQICMVWCGRRCSFPGHCGRYADSSGNGYFDNGECV